MKIVSRIAAVFAVLLVGIMALPVLAAPKTIVVTEAQINPVISSLSYTYGSYTVTNPSIDFRMGLVRINATVTQGGVAKAGRVVLAPSVSGGKVSWTIVSATLNGKPGTSAQIAFLSTTLSTLWTSYINTYYSGLYIVSVTPTETKITAVANS